MATYATAFHHNVIWESHESDSGQSSMVWPLVYATSPESVEMTTISGDISSAMQ